MNTLKQWWERLQATPPGRAWKRYNDARGGLLAGGVTYFAFLSIFPIMALAFAVFGVLLRGHPQWLTDIHRYASTALPGFVQDASGKGGIIPLTLPGRGTLATVGIIGVVGLLFGGLGWLVALRDGLRAIFGVGPTSGNVVTDKLRDIGLMLSIGFVILLSAVVAGFANGAAGFAAEHMGLGSKGWVVTVVGIVVQAVLNTAVVALILRLLTGLDLSWQTLRSGATFGGIGLTLLQLFGASLIKGTTHNKVFASIAVVVGLLVFLNFISRLLLVAAAWTANDVELSTPRAQLGAGQRLKATEGPDEGLPTGFKARTDAGLPTFSQRAADRTSLTAGAVLGAVAAVVVGSTLRGLRSLALRR
ncbi:MAG TPA: YihY/virulence factor BrkB family protein [Pedococcus sp.]|jgi:membrane protein|nr:YihY/virulence factor BrkB family protein [Pedococcus sp.]